MNDKNKNDGSKNLGKGRSSDKRKKQSPNDEDFNTGSHSPSSLRKVGPGYDDTGMGNGLQKAGSAKKVNVRKKR